MRFLVRVAVLASIVFAFVLWRRRHRASVDATAKVVCADTAPQPSYPPPAVEPVDDLDHDRTLARGSTTTFLRALSVKHGVRLTIEPGARVEFAKGAYLLVHGELVARGSDDAPIVFTNAGVGVCPGYADRWGGIGFADDALSGSTIEHAVVECSGDAPAESGIRAAISNRSPPRALSLAHLAFRGNGGIDVHSTSPFARFEDNELLQDGVSATMDVDVEVLPSIGARNRFGGSIRTSGNVRHSQTWPPFKVPIEVGQIVIDGELERAVLTLAEGTELDFTGDGSLDIGGDDGKGGALVARHVVFAGKADYFRSRWSGIAIFEHAEGTRIEASLITDANAGISVLRWKFRGDRARHDLRARRVFILRRTRSAM